MASLDNIRGILSREQLLWLSICFRICFPGQLLWLSICFPIQYTPYCPGKQMESHKSCFPLFKGYIVQGSKWKATKAVSLLGVYCPGKQLESHKSCFPLFKGYNVQGNKWKATKAVSHCLWGIMSGEANGKPQKLFPF